MFYSQRKQAIEMGQREKKQNLLLKVNRSSENVARYFAKPRQNPTK